MERGVLYVASRPRSPERLDEFNTWYDEVHLPEMCSLPGFVGARRFAPVRDDGPYVALYEIEGEDLDQIVAGMFTATKKGRLTLSDVVQTDPPPEIRVLKLTASHGVGASAPSEVG